MATRKKKKVTLESIASMLSEQGKILANQGKILSEQGEMLEHVVKHMATKEDLAELRHELKGDIAALGSQVASIEEELRAAKGLQVRIADLEEKVFGHARG